ncbi:hypothetical protein CYY_006208 [Polysphondylium violaceum]|uniref:Transcription elongation factor S-II n=1 Tax=Polysphondylium violaceum TaxID=133409 RepID=A0A8J4Q0P8_9MYCE|nr:hypothetical protein CYY_006208 [Polysphondylium violaceum]
MESELVEVKKQLDEAILQSDFDSIISCIKSASSFDMTKDLLKKTAIGVSIGKLRTHKDSLISKESKLLVDKWKAIVEKTNSETTTTKTTTTITKVEINVNSKPVKAVAASSTTTTSTTTTIKSENSSPSLSSSTSSTPPTTSSGTPKRKLESSDSSIKKIKVNKPITGPLADLRNKTIALIAESIVEGKDEDVATESTPEEIATEIESELFNIYQGVTKDYKAKIRSIKFNLKSNDQLKLSLLNRELDIEKFCSMDVMEMANKELQKEREKMAKYTTEAAISNTNNEATTDQFKCGKCKQRKCTYRQLQTRSADEPATTFVTCINCNHRWKFC